MANEEDKTLWCGNLHENVTEEFLYELFLQAGPLEGVKIPEKDGKKRNYAFITFKDAVSVPYSMDLMNGIRLFDRALRLQSRTGSSHASTSSTPGANTSHMSSSSPHGQDQGSPYRSPHGNSPHGNVQQNAPYRSPNSGERWQPQMNQPFSRSYSHPQFSGSPSENFGSNSRSGSNTPERQFSNSPDIQKMNSFPQGGFQNNSRNNNMGILGVPNMGMNIPMTPESLIMATGIGGMLYQGGAMNNFNNGNRGNHGNNQMEMEMKRQRLLQQQEEMLSRSNRHSHHRGDYQQQGHRHGYR